MLDIRPIVVNSDMVILGGNMRYRACESAGLKEVPVIIADNLTEEQQKEFLIKDNVSGGEWDWDILANEWDSEQLSDWGLDIHAIDNSFGNSDDDQQRYTKKIEAPVYVPSGEKPNINDLFDKKKYDDLCKEIKKSKLSDDVSAFLILAASRHIVFDYSKIADFYAHSDKSLQDLMEKSALVIIDFDKAIENGFAQLSQELAEQFKAEGHE